MESIGIVQPTFGCQFLRQLIRRNLHRQMPHRTTLHTALASLRTVRPILRIRATTSR